RVGSQAALCAPGGALRFWRVWCRFTRSPLGVVASSPEATPPRSGARPRRGRRDGGGRGRRMPVVTLWAIRQRTRARSESGPAPDRGRSGDTMFDGRWRSNFEKGLRPVGGQLRRTGITANHLTTTGLVMAVGASIAIANGALRSEERRVGKACRSWWAQLHQ